jgi:hypothetical protein
MEKDETGGLVNMFFAGIKTAKKTQLGVKCSVLVFYSILK